MQWYTASCVCMLFEVWDCTKLIAEIICINIFLRKRSRFYNRNMLAVVGTQSLSIFVFFLENTLSIFPNFQFFLGNNKWPTYHIKHNMFNNMDYRYFSRHFNYAQNMEISSALTKTNKHSNA
jgi:hypothetical protein